MTVDRRGWRVRLLTLWLPLAVAMFFALFPFYWMAITSLKSNQELYSRKVMPLIVHNPTLKHYVDLLTETSFLEWTWNTLIVAVISTAISLILGAMLAYPLARLRFAGAAMVSFAIAATYLVPQPLLFVPLADLINRLGLNDTLTSVILTYPTLLIPFCAWLLMGYFRTVPVGAIAELVKGDVFYWGQLMAAALLGSIPVAIIYSFFVEHYVAGLTAGSVKG